MNELKLKSIAELAKSNPEMYEEYKREGSEKMLMDKMAWTKGALEYKRYKEIFCAEDVLCFMQLYAILQTEPLIKKIGELEKENTDLEKFFTEFGEWTKKVFPDANYIDHLKKLRIEAGEAMVSPPDITEFADCLLAVFGVVYKAGFTLPELILAAKAKMDINRKREWVKLPDGTYQHK